MTIGLRGRLSELDTVSRGASALIVADGATVDGAVFDAVYRAVAFDSATDVCASIPLSQNNDAQQQRQLRRQLYYEVLRERHDEKTDIEWMYALNAQERNVSDEEQVTFAAQLHLRGQSQRALELLDRMLLSALSDGRSAVPSQSLVDLRPVRYLRHLIGMRADLGG